MNAAQCCESHALELVQSRESGPGLTARHGLLSSQQTHQVRFPLHFFSFRSDGLVTIVRDSPGQRNPLDIYFFWNCGLPIIFHSSNWWSLKQDQTLRFLSFWSVFFRNVEMLISITFLCLSFVSLKSFLNHSVSVFTDIFSFDWLKDRAFFDVNEIDFFLQYLIDG